MRFIKLAALALVAVAISVFASAQETPAQNVPTVKHVPITDAPRNSGVDMFNAYCAVCHGKDGKGNGPAAAALKNQPADLTLLSQKNGGKYPSAHVGAVIRGQESNPSHGSEEMPVWGPLFSSLSQGHDDLVQQRINNLTKYIETLQAK